MVLAAAHCHVHHIFFACYHALHIQPEPCKVHEPSPCPNPQLILTALCKSCGYCCALPFSVRESTAFADEVATRRKAAVAEVQQLRELSFVGQRAEVMEQRDERRQKRSRNEISEEKKKALEAKAKRKEEAKARRAAQKAWIEEQAKKLSAAESE